MRGLLTLFASLCLLGAACPRRDAPPSASPLGSETRGPLTSPASGAGAAPDAEPARLVQPRFEKQPQGARLAVLYTASVQGYVTPCGCTSDPLGGVSRLAALLDEAHAAYGERVLFLDAGDLLFEKPDDNLAADACQADARIELLLSTYARKGLFATVLGPLDDVRGAAFRDARLARHGIPTIGVPDAGRDLMAGAEHRGGFLVERAGVKIGITGFRADDEGRARLVQRALLDEVARLRREGAAAVLALAQAPRPLTEEIASDVAGLDVVIQGRAPGEGPSAPERLGAAGPWLVSAGAQAQHIGVLEMVLQGRGPSDPLTLDDRQAAAERRARLLDKRIEQYQEQLEDSDEGPRRAFLQEKLTAAKEERARLFRDADKAPPPAGPSLLSRAVALARGAPEEPAAKAALDGYEASIPALVAKCEAGMTCPEPSREAPIYVGVEACAACHAGAVAFWRQQHVKAPGKDASGKLVERTLSHASAWQTLVDDGKDKDRSCVGCHSVGFNQPGGYCRTSEVGALKNVQCESCHGPGSRHIELGGAKDALVHARVDEAVCRGCHHVPHIPTTESFVFEDKRKLILGPGHGEPRLADIIGGR